MRLVFIWRMENPSWSKSPTMLAVFCRMSFRSSMFSPPFHDIDELSSARRSPSGKTSVKIVILG